MYDEAAIRLKIRRLSEAVWEGRGKGSSVDEWLETFTRHSPDPDGDRLLLLHLLSNFLYFGIREMRELLNALFNDLFRQPIVTRIRRDHSNTIDIDLIDERFSDYLLSTRFLGVGNPSESGPHLLYYLRQETGLPSELFINHFELPGITSGADEAVRHYVFIDDLCATGNQAISYSDRIVAPLLEKCPEAEVSYYSLFATERGLRHTREHGRFTNVEAVMLLDDTFRCFGEQSRFYDKVPAEIDRERTRDLCRGFGEYMNPRHPLGFLDAELAIGFNHNTPDDTLPIFWVEPNEFLPMLRPVFRRYGKIGA